MNLAIGAAVGALVAGALAAAWVRWRISAAALTANRQARPGLWADWRRLGVLVVGRVVLVAAVVLAIAWVIGHPER